MDYENIELHMEKIVLFIINYGKKEQKSVINEQMCKDLLVVVFLNIAWFSCHKYNKEYKEKYQYTEYFDHEPAIFRNSLEIFENFAVCGFDIHFRILNI